VTIGNDVTVGAGAVVLPEATIPDGETWVGVPAKPR
jgi:serine acetyltransferase